MLCFSEPRPARAHPLTRATGAPCLPSPPQITAMGSGSPNRNLVVTCVEKADLDAILRSRARLAGSAAATEALLQK